MGREPAATLTKFAEFLQQRISAQRVLLFGSHAHGNTRPDSDYDFVVVSSRFEGVHPLERPIGLHELWWEAGGEAPIDLLCVTPQEFERESKGITLIAEILPTSVDLLPAFT